MLNKEGIIRALNKKDIYVANSDKNIASNSIRVTLSPILKVYENVVIDIKKDNPTKLFTIPETGFLLEPNRLYLGSTNEWTRTYNYVPLLNGQESLASQGMEVHITAGFGDNGFEGTWTLEIICTNPTLVYPGMVIGELCYIPLVGSGDILYRGKYYHQVEPTASRISREYEEVLTRRRKKC